MMMLKRSVKLTLLGAVLIACLSPLNVACDGSSVSVVTVEVPGAGYGGFEAVVLFFDANEKLLSRTATDSGLAMGPMRSGGSVLVINPFLLYSQVSWTLGVQPGDHLTIRTFDFGSYADTNAQIALGELPPGTVQLYFSTPCLDSTPWVQSESVSPEGVYDIQVCGYPFDLFVAAEIADGIDALPPLTTVIRGVQPDAFHDAVLQPAWSTASEFVVSLEGDPEFWRRAEFEFDAVQGGRPAFELPHIFRRFGRDLESGAWLTLPWLPELGSQGILSARSPQFVIPERSHARVQTVARWFEDVSAGVTFEIDELRMPTVDDVKFSRTGVNWRLVGEDDYDGMMISFSTWDVLAPPRTTSIRRPQLPQDLEQLWPEQNLTVTIQLLKEDGIAGYDEMRTMSWADISEGNRTWAARSRYRTVGETRAKVGE